MVKKKRSKKEVTAIVLLIFGIILLFLGIIWQLVWTFSLEKKYLFSDSEEQLLNGAKKYYELNPIFLPKEGQTSTVTYQTLYEKDFVESLKIPKTYETCDLENSWVRVYNEKGKYQYFTYLKCGKYESNTDHEGPNIVLNGEETIVVELNGVYEELGVKSVIDNVDGEIDIKNVKIETDVNTKELGTYKTTYTVTDKLLNQTRVTRKVIVRRMLKDAVIGRTDASNLFKGDNVDNNFILYSGMLFRIVGLNEDSSIKLVTAENISNVNYLKDDISFDNSNIQKWLNEYFYSFLIEPEKYLKQDGTFCISKITNPRVYEECTKYSEKMAVGLLSMQDIKKAEVYKNNQYSSYLDLKYYFLLSNESNVSNKALIKAGSYYTLTDFDKTDLLPIRPVINLKSDVFIVSGNGTLQNPFRIGDYDYGRENSLLSDRLSGEIVSLSGQIFKVLDHDKDGNTRMVMISNLLTTKNGFFNCRSVNYNTENKIKRYNPKEEGNIAEVINNTWTDYINDELLITHEYKVPNYITGQKYTDGEATTIKAKFAIPNTYELFSASADSNAVGKYYLLNVSSDEESVLFINNMNGLAFNLHYKDYPTIGAKLVVYVDKNVVISSGKGISTDPYFLKKGGK